MENKMTKEATGMSDEELVKRLRSWAKDIQAGSTAIYAMDLDLKNAATSIEALTEQLEAARADTKKAVEALRMADTALYEAEAILGGEYGDLYGPLCDQISKLRATLAEIEGEKE
jgi:hypothetical protein